MGLRQEEVVACSRCGTGVRVGARACSWCSQLALHPAARSVSRLLLPGAAAVLAIGVTAGWAMDRPTAAHHRRPPIQAAHVAGASATTAP